MTNEELMAALLSGEQVQSWGIVYACVSAIVCRKDNKGGVYIQAELADKNGNSVTISAPDRVSIYKEGSQ